MQGEIIHLRDWECLNRYLAYKVITHAAIHSVNYDDLFWARFTEGKREQSLTHTGAYVHDVHVIGDTIMSNDVIRYRWPKAIIPKQDVTNTQN